GGIRGLVASRGTWTPGARRAIFALLPFYLLAGGGLAEMLRRVRRPLFSGAVLLLIAGVAVGVQLRGAEQASANYMASFWNQPRSPVPDAVFLDEVARHDFFLIAEHEFDLPGLPFRPDALSYSPLPPL